MTDDQRKRVLLVQESPTQAQALALTLEEADFDVQIAADVDTALEFLRRRPFDVVITALSLPGRSGLELCSAVRSTAEWRCTAVVTLVGVEAVGQILESLQAGADGYIRKNRPPDEAVGEIQHVLQRTARPTAALPVSRKVVFGGQTFEIGTDANRLLSVLMSSLADLATFISGPVTEAAIVDAGIDDCSDDADGTAEPVPLRVLLVDDSATNRTLGRALLSSAGHEVETAGNGVEAVDLATTRPFDVILMDVEMPEMDGLEATREIRRREAASSDHTPVFAMSAHDAEADHQRCLEAGMDSCLSKPIRVAEVESALSTVSRSTGPASQDVVTGREVECPVGWAAALENMEGDEEILQEVIRETIEETPGLLVLLEQALVDGDGEEVARLAHTIKSAGRTFGADRLTGQAEVFEQQGPLDPADPRIADLRRTVMAFVKELRHRLDGKLSVPENGSAE